MLASVLSRLFLGGAAPPYCAIRIPLYQCFRGCCTPIRVMACKTNLHSIIIITKQLYIC